MTSTVESTPVASRLPFPRVLIITATLLAGGTIAMIWIAAVPWGPLVCPAVYPSPPNCQESQRIGSGLVASVCVSVVYLATLLTALRRTPASRAMSVVGLIALVLAPVVSYLSVAWAPGFTV